MTLEQLYFHMTLSKETEPANGTKQRSRDNADSAVC